jgi:uncharacterized protein
MASKGIQIFRKWNRILHRDLAYFFFGLTIIYCISGIALNHIKQWNSNYKYTYENVSIGQSLTPSEITKIKVLSILDKYGEKDGYKNYYIRDDDTLNIVIKDSYFMTLCLKTGSGYTKKIVKRPFLYEVNFLHYNKPGRWWTWFSDAFCVGLIIIAVTGLFVIAKSKASLTRRGIWFILAGLIIPVLALLIFR